MNNFDRVNNFFLSVVKCHCLSLTFFSIRHRHDAFVIDSVTLTNALVNLSSINICSASPPMKAPDFFNFLRLMDFPYQSAYMLQRRANYL